MKRKGIAAALAVLAAILAAVNLYGASYSIKADNSNFQEAAQTWLSRGMARPTVRQVTLRQTLDLGGTRLVLVELDDGLEPGPQLGLFHLKRGWNGKYQITSSGYGGGNLWDQVVRDGDSAYYLLGGRNRLFDIREASFIMEKDDGWEESYRAAIPEADYFLTAVEIDPAVESQHCEPGSLRLYNSAGEDITIQAG